MNRYLNLISGELPEFNLHDWLLGKTVVHASGSRYRIYSSCFVDGVLWVYERSIFDRPDYRGGVSWEIFNPSLVVPIVEIT